MARFIFIQKQWAPMYRIQGGALYLYLSHLHSSTSRCKTSPFFGLVSTVGHSFNDRQPTNTFAGQFWRFQGFSRFHWAVQLACVASATRRSILQTQLDAESVAMTLFYLSTLDSVSASQSLVTSHVTCSLFCMLTQSIVLNEVQHH